MKTTYIVQPFDEHKIKGQPVLKPVPPMQFNNEADALRRAEGMAYKHTHSPYEGVLEAVLRHQDQAEKRSDQP